MLDLAGASPAPRLVIQDLNHKPFERKSRTVPVKQKTNHSAWETCQNLASYASWLASWLASQAKKLTRWFPVAHVPCWTTPNWPMPSSLLIVISSIDMICFVGPFTIYSENVWISRGMANGGPWLGFCNYHIKKKRLMYHVQLQYYFSCSALVDSLLRRLTIHKGPALSYVKS